DHGGVDRQRDGREWATIPLVAADHLRGEMLRVRRTAAIAERVEPTTLGESPAQQLSDVTDQGQQRLDAASCLDVVAKLASQQLTHLVPSHDASSRAGGCPA